MQIRNVLTAIVGVVVGFALLPIINTAITTASEGVNNPIVVALLGLAPILYILGILAGLVYFATRQ